MENYKVISGRKRLQRQSRIPKEWLLPENKYQGLTNFMSIPTTCGILSDTECEITSNHDATALLEKLHQGVWSSEEVTIAFCKRAAIAQQLTNCLTEIFFDDAIKKARELDNERLANPGKPLRPFHGLPISLKDSFQVAGYDTSTGLACFVDEPAQENSGTAAMLLGLGAVLYCKTNLPQTIMTADSDNNVFGRTLNPRNTDLTAGGSTGGEGALLALRGSVLGVGTDIAGSVRVPAICNGIYGFRASVGIVPHGGVRNLTAPGTVGVLSTAGPMATSLRDVNLFIKNTMESGTWKYDSSVISLPWTNKRPKNKIRIGLALDDGICTPTPPVRRGLSKAADLLRKNHNVELVPLTLPNTLAMYGDLFSYLTVSGNETYLDFFARTGEPQVPSVAAIKIASLAGSDLRTFFELNVRREAASREYHKLFLDNDIDAILMPPAAHTALPLDKWTTATSTGIWNYLDYPAIVLPVDTVRESDIADDISNAKYGDMDASIYGLYTGPEQYRDAPITVQLVGYHQADEALANTAVMVDSIINGEVRC